MNCENCKNYCSTKPTYKQFHVDRIVRILESGTEPAVIPRNSDDKIPVTIREAENKILWITSSLFEMGIIEEYSEKTKPQIKELEWKKFEDY